MMNTTKPLVTIAIPTFNRASSYLASSLGSALRQTYDNLEIVVADNCSQDHTQKLVVDYGSERIRYFRHSHNIGAVNNFNFCLAQARGQYFLLLHDDDLIDDDFIATCLRGAVSQPQSGLIRTGTRVVDANGRVLAEFPNRTQGLSSDDFFRGWFANLTVWYLASTLFDTRRLREAGGFDTKYTTWPEANAIIRLATSSNRVDIEAVKASFREHAGEITSATGVVAWCDDSKEVLEMICAHAEDAALLRAEGRRHFSEVNYSIAGRMTTTLQRVLGHLIVLRKFGYPPPIFYRVLHKSPCCRRLLHKLGLATRGMS